MTPEAIHIRDGRIVGTSVRSQLSGTPPDGTYYRVDAPTLLARVERLEVALRKIAGRGEIIATGEVGWHMRQIALAALSEGGGE